MQSITFRAMGCQMHAFLDSETDDATALIQSVPRWFAEWERILSRFRTDSELSALNRQAGKGWVRVSPTLWEVVNDALVAARMSDGLVTPTVLPVMEMVGYDRDFAQVKNGELVAAPVAAPPPGDWRALRLDPARRAVMLPPGMRLDLGGIAKGWAAERAARRLARYGPALVDAGGDIAVRGARVGGEPWVVGVDDPLRPGEHLAILLLTGGGVATSGRDVRRWRQGNVERHHIIDPRTGAPAQTDILAATVVAPSLHEAEVAAKVVMILGRRAGMLWLNARPSLAGLLVTATKDTLHTSTLDQYRWRARVLEVSHE
jgi:Membrane-associated lipoprotein involved in thiamine biosynthesis